jgi:hypothetical protein
MKNLQTYDEFLLESSHDDEAREYAIKTFKQFKKFGLAMKGDSSFNSPLAADVFSAIRWAYSDGLEQKK